jgi:hypothetical protein
MVTTNGGAKAPTKNAPPSAPVWTPQQDAKLVAYVRANAPHIVAGLLTLAAGAGEERNWNAMQESQAMAGKLSELCGLKAISAAQATQAAQATANSTKPATMAAAAGG